MINPLQSRAETHLIFRHTWHSRVFLPSALEGGKKGMFFPCHNWYYQIIRTDSQGWDLKYRLSLFLELSEWELEQSFCLKFGRFNLKMEIECELLEEELCCSYDPSIQRTRERSTFIILLCVVLETWFKKYCQIKCLQDARIKKVECSLKW